MIELPGGPFQMGDDRIGDARPAHVVVLHSFWIASCEVTNKQFASFMKRGRPPESPGDKQPATRISYPLAQAYCHWLSVHEHRHYRLPTEAEWEYAARGGLQSGDYPWGEGSPVGKANYFSPYTTPVHTYPPNGFGLYDMGSNVFNWCSDWYRPDFYRHSPVFEPRGPSTPTGIHVVRGASSSTQVSACALRGFMPAEAISRYGVDDQRGRDGSGFRVVFTDRSW